MTENKFWFVYYPISPANQKNIRKAGVWAFLPS